MNLGSDCQTQLGGKTGDFTSEQPMCQQQPGDPDDILRGKTDILWRGVNLWQL